MHPHVFKFLRIVGLWPSNNWTNFQKKAYNIYAFFILSVIASRTLFEVIYLFNAHDSIEELVDSTYVLFSTFLIIGKGINLLCRYKRILRMTKILQDDQVQYLYPKEEVIQNYFDRTIRFNALFCGILFGGTVSFMILLVVINDIPKRQISKGAWSPYDATTSIGFWMTFWHLAVAYFADTGINGSYDLVISGMMIKVCAQLVKLEYRFTVLPRLLELDNIGDQIKDTTQMETARLGDCIKYHRRIFEISKEIGDVFGPMLFLQYFVSAGVLCVTVFKLSQLSPSSPDFVLIAMYMTCMFIQIFIICFYGQELTLKSYSIGDAIYNMDWTELTLETKKSLIFIMRRSLRPITISGGNFITLSIDSFNSLIKISYSAFSVLHESH